MPQSPSSIWTVKPWWCQPWSIVLTGMVVPSGMWLLTHRLWIVLPIAAAVLLWWVVFLYLVPRQYAVRYSAVHPIGQRSEQSSD